MAMSKRKVFTIAGLSVVLVLVGTTLFVWNVNRTPTETTAELPDTEEVGETDDVEIRKWTEVLSEGDVKIRVVNMTALRNEPFLTAEEIDQLEAGLEGAEIALCMENSIPMGWSKVEIDGETGYVDALDIEYIYDEAVAEEVETPEESIVEVAEEEVPAEEETPTEEESVPVEEEVADTEPVAEPEDSGVAEVPQEQTPSEPVVETTPSGSEVTTVTQKQAQESYSAEIDAWLNSMGATGLGEVNQGSAGNWSGDGTHYGDLE